MAAASQRDAESYYQAIRGEIHEARQIEMTTERMNFIQTKLMEIRLFKGYEVSIRPFIIDEDDSNWERWQC